MKYLFFDVDGTLLSPTTFEVPKSTLQAIRMAQNKGHVCFLCTGRSYGMCRELKHVGIPHAIICNGAGIVINGKVVGTHPIDKHVFNKTMDSIMELSGGFQILDDVRGYQNPKTWNYFRQRFLNEFPSEMPEEVFRRKAMVPIQRYMNSEVLKIDVAFDTKKQGYYFLDHLDNSLQFVESGGYLNGVDGFAGEITRKGVSKASAIQELIEYIGADMKDTIAFGDSTNDIEMLKVCGRSVAVGDAPESVKAVADIVTDTVDEGGIANAMRRLQLI